jgi:hypothetical protein
MESFFKFLPVLLFLGFFVLPAAGFLFLVIKIITKSKNSAWKGVIIDKKHNEFRNRDNPKRIDHTFYLVVKTDNGREMKVGLSQQMWEKFSVGEKLEKPKGSLWPNKIT